ncbi:DUF2249 domain-containing protein [Ramlibacter sp. MMS24-I3-19]|uniref:DUF2249 domain-containing protein n=1 Tax=Ramlibacter sp. MMS24-I3-19 TaxID=3416606 RepID=UPI003D046E20
MPSPATRIDVRELEPRERHPTIFATFQALRSGEFLELVNDHDPQPLHRQFELLASGEFDWRYLQQGPALWRVAITRLRPPQPSSTCCGSCGGA